MCGRLSQYSGIHDFVAGGMVDIHDRRPVVLSSEQAQEWMDPATPKERAEEMVLHLGEPTDVFE